MSPEQAKEALRFHSGAHPDIEDVRWERGFLGCLRPFRGALVEDNFHDVMAALAALSVELGSAEWLEREVVADVVAIVHLARAWGVDEGGMLRRNELISAADVERLEVWLGHISHAFATLLSGAGPDEAFADYRDYASASEGDG